MSNVCPWKQLFMEWTDMHTRGKKWSPRLFTVCTNMVVLWTKRSAPFAIPIVSITSREIFRNQLNFCQSIFLPKYFGKKIDWQKFNWLRKISLDVIDTIGMANGADLFVQRTTMFVHTVNNRGDHFLPRVCMSVHSMNNCFHGHTLDTEDIQPF